jgi:alpha-mannosidase
VVPVSAAELRTGSAVAELWEDVFLPPHAVWLRQATALRAPDLDLRLEGDGLVFSSLKPAEEHQGIVLRCYSTRGEAVEGRWRSSRPVSRAALIRADERAPHELILSADRRSIGFRAPARGIVSVLVTPGPYLAS